MMGREAALEGININGVPLCDYLREKESKETQREVREDVKRTERGVYCYRKPRLKSQAHKERNAMPKTLTQSEINREYLHENIKKAKGRQQKMIAFLLSAGEPMTSDQIAKQLSALTGESWSRRSVPSVIGPIRKSDLGKFILRQNYLRDVNKGGIVKGFCFTPGARELTFGNALELYNKGNHRVNWQNCDTIFPFLAEDKKAILEQRSLYGPRTKEQVEEGRKPKPIPYIKTRRRQLRSALSTLEKWGPTAMADEECAKILSEIFGSVRVLFRSETGPGYGVRFPDVADEYLLQLGEEVENIANLHPGNTQVTKRIAEIRQTIDMLYGAGSDPAAALQLAGQKIINILQDCYHNNQAVQVEAEAAVDQMIQYTGVPGDKMPDDRTVAAGNKTGMSFVEALERYLPKMSSGTRKEIFKALSGSGFEIGDNKTFTINPSFHFHFHTQKQGEEK